MAQNTYLPGIYHNKIDGNLIPEKSPASPRMLIIGTAAQGPSTIYLVRNTATAKNLFGTTGTLVRGMFEAKSQGADEMLLYRIGCTAATLEHIGDSLGVGGYTITTYRKDDDAGSTYSVWYDDSEDRLVVMNEDTELIVYDNDADAPIDEDEVVVSGYRAAAGGPDIGNASNMVLMEDVTAAGTVFTAGTDGVDLSRMEMYEELFKAYKELIEYEFDVVAPMDVYLDDLNIVDQGHALGAVLPKVPSGSTYPTPGAYTPVGANPDVDALGKVFAEEYQGEWYFFWDIDNDGEAEIFPTGVGAASATTKIDGDDLTSANFHEVNFAYQLARFLYECSLNTFDASGTIGVRPPDSNTLADKSAWIGTEPTLTLNNATGISTITSASNNGSGLLGNKFMAGMYGYRSGHDGGGFILTDGDYLDSGSEVEDTNDIPIDLGKFIDVVIDYPLLTTGYSSTSYVASFASGYGGMYVNMPLTDAPTNKATKRASIYFKVGMTNLDKLVGKGYVCLRQRPRGVVIADAPTAALPTSDYTRRSTCRIVKSVIDGVRDVLDPFIGKNMSAAEKAAAHTAVEGVLLKAKKLGILTGYQPFEIYQSRSMAVRGDATVDLTLAPAFELRQVDVNISLTAEA